MKNSKQMFALGGAALLALAGVVNAEAPATDAALKAEMATLKARIGELEGKQSQQWLDARRTEEVKALVREVLSDADTRASLQNDGLTAGHANDKFFLASQDGTFHLNIGGQIQVGVGSVQGIMPHIQSGKLRAIGATGIGGQC